MCKKVLSLLAICLLACTFAAAQASRTWVSGVGNDANPCSRTAPCKTFAGAISKTAAGGEIDVLDPGGFGALTITKAITIDGGGGQVASVLVAGTNGIVVQAGASDVVILRNLSLQGISQSSIGGGLTAINYLSGKTLVVENCNIMNFTTNGIWAQGSGQLVVRNSTITNVAGSGIRVEASSVAAIEDTNLSANNIGLHVLGKATVVRTTAAQNSSRGFSAATGGEVNVTDSTAANNANGVFSSGTIRVSNVAITDNTSYGIYLSGGQVLSWGNNHVAGNTNSMTPSAIAPQ